MGVISVIDVSVRIGNLRLSNPVFLAAGPLTTRMENLITAEEIGLGAVDTKVTVSEKFPKTKCFQRMFWDSDMKILSWMLGFWGGEFVHIEDSVKFIKDAKKQLTIPVFGNFKGESEQTDEWIVLAKRLEEAGADGLITFFTFIDEFVGREMEMMEKIIAPICSTVKIPVVFKLQPIAGLDSNISKMANIMEDVGLSAIQISDGIGGYPPLRIDKPPYHPFECIDLQARDGFISGPYLRPLVYKTVFEYFSETKLPIICSGGIWNAQSAIEAILYGSSVIASASGPCLEGWKMFKDVILGIENYMKENHYSSLKEFKGLAAEYIKENEKIDYPDCYAVVDKSKCIGCEKCLPPAHCNAIKMHNEVARIHQELCVGCCICKYLCPTNAIEMKLG
jgi:dihydroorotate dehydrogenase/NAD-dependent dihydropyrimidine dehydrogenase PreA subunit